MQTITMFQTLIGTVKRLYAFWRASRVLKFQTLIGTVKSTMEFVSSLPDPGFKPS